MKKNFLKIFVLLFSFSASLMPVSARDVEEENNDDCPTCSMVDAPHNIDYEAVEYYQSLSENAALYNLIEAAENPFNGSRSVLRASVTAQGWANGGITRYYQTDYTDLLCPNTSSVTIASHGCVVTSFAMIATKYGINVTPLDVRTRLNADAPGTASACNFPWFDVVTVSPFTSLIAQEITDENWNVAYDNIEGAILANRPVLAFMYGPTGTHAVVVYGFEHYSDGGEFHYIFNPDPRNESRQMSLEEYRRDGWSINRLMVYYK